MTATRRASGAASKRAGEAWEQYVSSQWLEPLRKLGVLRCWHKLEPRKVGDRFVADAGADFVACMWSGESARTGQLHSHRRKGGTGRSSRNGRKAGVRSADKK